MDERPADQVNVSGLDSEGPSRQSMSGRPWIGIQFDCCGTYARVYRNADATAYQGRCPRCLRMIRLKVGPGGTDARFFVAE